MKILIYSHFYPPETGAAAVRMKYFVKVLENISHNVTVINPVPNYPNGKKDKGLKRFFYKAENVYYLPIYVPHKDSTIKRSISYLSYFVSSFLFTFFFVKKHEIIISSSPPIFTSLGAAFLSKIKGSHFILDIRDIWPDIGIQLGITKNPLVISILSLIEKYVTRVADSIIVTAKGDKLNLVKKGIPANKISVIYNGADTEIFNLYSQENKMYLRQKMGLPISKKLIVYFGSLNYGMNDIVTMAESLKRLSRIKSDIHFVLIGDGVHKKYLVNEIKNYINVSQFGPLPLKELSEIIAACDLSLIPRKKIKTDTGGNIPVKCFESWAAGLPVIISSINGSEINEIVKKSEAGFIVPPGDPQILAEMIANVISRGDLQELGVKGRNFVVKNFDRKTQSENLMVIIRNTLKIKSE